MHLPVDGPDVPGGMPLARAMPLPMLVFVIEDPGAYFVVRMPLAGRIWACV